MFIKVNNFMLESFDVTNYHHFLFLTKMANDTNLSKVIDQLDIKSWKTKKDNSLYGYYLLYYNDINIGFTRLLNNNNLEVQCGMFEEYNNKKLDILFLKEFSDSINNKQLNLESNKEPVFKQL